jgi:hypothetical protein
MRSKSRAPSVEYNWIDDPDEAEKMRVNAIRYVPETTALKTVEGKLFNDPDLPIYLLEDAAIYKKDGSFGNLLNAELDGNCTVRGRLAVEKGQLKDRKSISL